jgi:hypothetical protein
VTFLHLDPKLSVNEILDVLTIVDICACSL